LQFRERTFKSYPEIFADTGSQGGFSARAQFSSKWNWYNSLYRLSGGDITKYGYVAKMNIHECLLFLCYKSELDELDANELRKNFKK
jgi:hypothetical protein